LNFGGTSAASKVEEFGIVTKSEIDSLKTKAETLFFADNYEAAIPVLIELSKKANWIANVISLSNDPYHNATPDEIYHMQFARYKPYIALAYEYAKKRDIALAMQGECLLKTGDKMGAIPVLLKALSLMNCSNVIWWGRTRKNLLSIIEVRL